MKITQEFLANVRSSIQGQLCLLANAPAEFLCGWFDVCYLPESPAFQAAFSRSELDALAEFNDPFAAVSAELPEPVPPLCDLQATPAWGRVSCGASKALHSLSGRNV